LNENPDPDCFLDTPTAGRQPPDANRRIRHLQKTTAANTSLKLPYVIHQPTIQLSSQKLS